MGLLFSITYKKFFQNKDTKILMLGLDGAGKSTILYKLKLGENVITIPTIGFNYETIHYGGFNMNIMDIGGQDRIRMLWQKYFHDTQGIIFVVDSNDIQRIQEVKMEIEKILQSEDLKSSILLIYANKQDLPNSINPNELSRRLGLSNIKNQWKIQGTCAVNGDGLYEGLDWLGAQINENF